MKKRINIRINKRIKKAVGMVTAAALVLSLSACGSTESSSTASGSTESSTSEVTAAVAGETYTGTVASISEESMTLTTDDGDVSITLSSDTTFSYGMGDGAGGGSAPGGDGSVPDGGSDGTDSSADSADSTDSTDRADSSESTDSSESSGTESSDGSVPELPDGETAADGTAPDGDGTAPSGDDSAPDASGEMETLTYENVSEGDTVTVVINDEGTAESVTISMDSDAQGGTGEGGEGGEGGDGAGASASGSDNSSITYTAVNEYTESTEVSGETISSDGTDENAVLVSAEGAGVTLDGVAITRDSDDSTGGDNSSFYGVGASALVTDGTLTVTDSTIESDAAGGAGVFAYGDGTAYVSNTTITTQQDTSGGIHVAGGGTLYAWDLTVETNGESSAAIRSDRGSGTMVADGGTYTSNGTGSPAVYSTADITVNEATLTANASEAVCIEGLNTIRLFDCDLTGNMADDDQNDCTWNVILYQSQSGDSEEGNSTFEMVGGTLTAKNGGMFYTTNTESTFIISDVDITYADDSEFLLKCTGNSNERGWGSTGSNGADCTFTAIAQELEGDVIWDTISQLDFYLTDGSTLTGAVLNDESNAGDGGDGYANLYIDADSTWTVTGDSALGALYNAGTITDADGNTVSIVGSDGTSYVSGDSAYTITVDSYSTDADLSGAGTVDSFSDYEVSQS